MATLVGVDSVLAKLGAALSSAGDLTKEGMQDVANDIWQRAADKAPVKTGALRGSGAIGVVQNGDEITAEISFNEKYAAVQHERVDFHHPKGGEAKYLEKAAMEKADQVRAKVAGALEGLFGGG